MQGSKTGKDRERKTVRAREREQGRMRARWWRQGGNPEAYQHHLALPALGGKALASCPVGASMSAHTHPYAPVCVCVCVHVCTSNRIQALRSKAVPSPSGRAGAPDCRDAGSSRRAVQGGGQAGAGLSRVSVSACVGAAAWGRRAAASTSTCACLPLWWLGGRVGEGYPLPLSHLPPNFPSLAAGP